MTASNSDGVAGIPSNPGLAIPGLVTLSASGTVLGRVATGALPEGVALLSNAAGAAQTAFVLNAGYSTMSVVDVSNPASPTVVATLPIGVDPTPPEVQRGRILFSAARASTNGTFSCESCHPQGHVDQLLWVINTLEGPADVPGCDPGADDCPEPRSTMPIRGLRDTIPLHWVGTLADPIPGVFLAEDDGAPDCNLATDGEVGCIRHLVDGAIAGVMCAQPGCPTGPTGEPGALSDAERDDMAAFLAAVSYPPSPSRRPTDALTATARTGVGDFFLDRGGAFTNPRTCADINGGCHGLPLGVATNSPLVGRFDAPTMRGLEDRFLLFSNGLFGSEEFLASAGFSLATTGFTEFRSLAATFPNLFTLAYNVPVTNIWAFSNEQTIGLAGHRRAAARALAGQRRQRDDRGARRADRGLRDRGPHHRGRAHRPAAVALEERALDAAERPRHLARRPARGRRRQRPARDHHRRPPAKLQAGGAARQPLLWVADNAQGPAVPRIRAGTNGSFTAFAAYIESGAKVLVNGTLCAACTATWNAGAGTVQVGIAPAPSPAGTYVVQVMNPEGFASNELPLVTTTN